MWQLATAVVEIALRRRGPDGLPDSSFLVALFLALQVVLMLVVAVVVTGGLTAEILWRFGARLALFFAFVYAVLRFFRLERRYRQTVSAMLAANLVITLAFLPVAMVATALGIDVLGISFIAVSGLFDLWSIFIAASILARSLSQPLIVGFMFEILLVLTSFYVGQLLDPPAPPAAVESA